MFKKQKSDYWIDKTDPRYDPCYPVARKRIEATITFKWDGHLKIIVDGVEYTPSTIKNIPDKNLREHINRKIPIYNRYNEKFDKIIAS